ncbi:hypothetical protein N5C54_20930 [Pseudomonas chengduensis]|nr:hypothetical protein [Pseudomonas chengduensis]MDH0960248.1 hypothetical protein [Pseudomonas chengduensis]
MSEQLKTFLSGLLYGLFELRKFGHNGGHRITYALGQISAAERLGVLTFDQAKRFRDLLISAGQYASRPFPCDENAGPCMPIDVWWARHKTALEVKARLAKPAVIHMGGYDFVDASQAKPQARDSANEKSEPVPAPTSRPALRLLCVLVKSKLDPAQGTYLPIHTMHRLPPRAMVKGQWSEPRYAGLYLRETQARQPSTEVLERCLPKRHLRTNGRLSVLGGTV